MLLGLRLFLSSLTQMNQCAYHKYFAAVPISLALILADSTRWRASGGRKESGN